MAVQYREKQYREGLKLQQRKFKVDSRKKREQLVIPDCQR